MADVKHDTKGHLKTFNKHAQTTEFLWPNFTAVLIRRSTLAYTGRNVRV